MPTLNPEVQVKIYFKHDGKGLKDAEHAVDGFHGTLKRVGELAAGIGLERLAEKFIQVGKAAADFAVDTASKFEQWKMSFDTMLGSSEKASVLLSQISDFATK